jgi:ferredoxin
VALTTDLPLEVDKPIDFGLQYFCSNCLKCARECPVNALPFGDKVMFNAYEIWKPDVERCARYRITNQKGSACGRCMKTCPLNKVVSADGSVVHRVGTWLGVNARWLKPVLVPLAVFFDDWFGYGTRNSVKQWWLNLEVVDGVCVIPKATNERDIDITRDTSGKKTPVGYYSASVMPQPNARGSVPANHKGAVERAAELETVEEAKQRIARGGERPAHYIPTLSIED